MTAQTIGHSPSDVGAAEDCAGVMDSLTDGHTQVANWVGLEIRRVEEIAPRLSNCEAFTLKI